MFFFLFERALEESDESQTNTPQALCIPLYAHGVSRESAAGTLLKPQNILLTTVQLGFLHLSIRSDATLSSRTCCMANHNTGPQISMIQPQKDTDATDTMIFTSASFVKYRAFTITGCPGSLPLPMNFM